MVERFQEEVSKTCELSDPADCEEINAKSRLVLENTGKIKPWISFIGKSKKKNSKVGENRGICSRKFQNVNFRFARRDLDH